MLAFFVPGEVVGKGRPRFVRATGRVYTPVATQRYEDAIRYGARDAMGDRAPIEGPVAVRLEAVFPVPTSWSKKKQREAVEGLHKPTKKPDCDNILKLVDAMNAIVWRDDVQIVEASISKRFGDRPGLHITVTAEAA